MEAGGHRIQRVPPTERKGRVHTSTVIVAVLDPERSVDPTYLRRSDSDFQVEWFSGSGAGGQHRNKHQNSCRLTHVPTGLIEARQTRSRDTSYREARSALEARLEAMAGGAQQADMAADRKSQVGSGMRGDKTVTIQFQDDRIQHHVTNRTMSAGKYMKGFMDELWNETV